MSGWITTLDDDQPNERVGEQQMSWKRLKQEFSDLSLDLKAILCFVKRDEGEALKST